MTVLGRDTSERLRDCAAVQGFVERVCFKTGPPGLVGAELEWLVAVVDDPTDPVPIPLLRTLIDAAGPPPRGSSVTYEPGGQLELSSPAFRGPSACWQALTEDAEHVRRALAPGRVVLLPTAIDPFRSPAASCPALATTRWPPTSPPTGRRDGPGDDDQHRRRCRSTSTSAPTPTTAPRRWRLLHEIGPVMVAAFANSPVHAGRDTGWKSARQRVWQRLDRERTRCRREPTRRPPGPTTPSTPG